MHKSITTFCTNSWGEMMCSLWKSRSSACICLFARLCFIWFKMLYFLRIYYFFASEIKKEIYGQVSSREKCNHSPPSPARCSGVISYSEVICRPALQLTSSVDIYLAFDEKLSTKTWKCLPCCYCRLQWIPAVFGDCTLSLYTVLSHLRHSSEDCFQFVCTYLQ